MTKDERIMPTLTDGADFVMMHKGKFTFPHIDAALTEQAQLKLMVKEEL